MVSMKFERTHPGPFRFHAHGSPVPAEELESIVPGLCVVREELCFLQAGVWMSALELVEYGYELCGCYEVCPWRFSDEITERERSLSRAGLATYVKACSGLRGSRLASKSLVRVRDGAKSPMEAATAMLVVMPRKDGGLGYRGVELNRRVPVPEALRCLTRSSELEVDIYSAKERAGVEYDGEDHAEAAQRARDAERLAVLAAMDIRVNVVTKGQFLSQLSLNRAMNVVARNLGVAPDFSPEFQRAQNDLRKFLIRGWASNSR